MRDADAAEHADGGEGLQLTVTIVPLEDASRPDDLASTALDPGLSGLLAGVVLAVLGTALLRRRRRRAAG